MKGLLSNMWPTNHETVRSFSSSPPQSRDGGIWYNPKVDAIRDLEYPTLVGATYLDHAGTTPYAKSLIENWTAELTTNLFGNPHSASAASQLSTRRIDDIRLRVLRFFGASPDDFDVVFVANATAAIKLVAEAFRDNEDGFWYGFHADSHTSLVGCRELAVQGSYCFQDDGDLEAWIASVTCQNDPSNTLQLVAYPGQSNMTGRKIPIRYCEQVREKARTAGRKLFTLLDVASLASTSPLDLSDAATAPDFIALSFYKIFGFPDLGALIVRKESAQPLLSKRFFAGGTVDGVAVSGAGWHVKKSCIHDALEEGTLPFHNILALNHAMDVHQRLFESMEAVSSHTKYLAREAYRFLQRARHANGTSICQIYGDWNQTTNGPIIAFNLKDSLGRIISASEVEKLCIVKGVQVRTGGLCNPGGIACHLDLNKEQIESNYAAGRRCGGESELIDGRPTGVIRISFGAMSSQADLSSFTNFLQEYYVEQNVLGSPERERKLSKEPQFTVHSLAVYPIKSCGAFQIPLPQRWQVRAKGLAWDREWCLVHEGTNVALSQKKYPRMALLQPELDLERRTLTISYHIDGTTNTIEIDLDETPSATTLVHTCQRNTFKIQNSKVCGDTIPIQVYTSPKINNFFSKALDVPCCLARYPRDTTHIRNVSIRKPKSDATTDTALLKIPQLNLSNESPILVVSISSVDELNQQIFQNVQAQGKPAIPVSPSTFRANIIVAQANDTHARLPYIEDTWTSLSITRPDATTPSTRLPVTNVKPDTDSSCLSQPSTSDSDNDSDTSIPSMPGSFSSSPPTSTLQAQSPPQHSHKRALRLNILGPCQRCQMLSINQATAASQQEPFCTLVKTRRRGDGRVWFGMHAALDGDEIGTDVGVGDLVGAESRR